MQEKWSTIIKPKVGLLDMNLKEFWQYRDLLFLFVKRNFKTIYMQTILGPLWIIINPMLTTIVFTIIFGNIANIGTDGVPQFLFYMTGNLSWIYFSTCLIQTSNTFIANAHIFGKVYFPRLITPVAVVITNLGNLCIQALIFFGFLAYYTISGAVKPNIYILLVPVLLLIISLIGLGIGIIISSLTTKYRDLNVLVGFGMQLWMYATPVVYPISEIPERWAGLIMLNPISSVTEAMRFAFLGSGEFPLGYLIYSAVFAVVAIVLGLIMFSHIERTFMDTV